jgi:hypothetical protein
MSFLTPDRMRTVMRRPTRVWPVILALGLLAGGTAGLAEAAGKDVAGTWRFFVGPRPPDGRLAKLELKQDGDKLTGKVTLPGGMTQEIRDGKVTDKGVSFFIQVGADGPKVYHTGAVVGDTLKGKTEFERPGGPRRPHLDWQAERVVN